MGSLVMATTPATDGPKPRGRKHRRRGCPGSGRSGGASRLRSRRATAATISGSPHFSAWGQ